MKALIAMSGGVDSSIAAKLAMDKGYEPIGCYMHLFDADQGVSPVPAAGAAPMETLSDSPLEIGVGGREAGEICRQLGIPFYVLDLRDAFRQAVIDPFIQAYREGRTPNPCVFCNRGLKFGILLEKMAALGCEKLMTGHYAKVAYDEAADRFLLQRADDKGKDQSYVLYQLTQAQLSHIEFPLGGFHKEETRSLAADSRFRNADRKDSQDICFIPDGDYAAFIRRYTRMAAEPGDFINAAGKKLGEHKGIIHYTIGQRKGLGIPGEKPYYVTKIDTERNQVTLGDNEDLFHHIVYAEKINFIPFDRAEEPVAVEAKVRYRQEAQPAMLEQVGEDRIKVTFANAQRAVTPGQSLVLYQGDLVVGGGIITGKE